MNIKEIILLIIALLVSFALVGCENIRKYTDESKFEPKATDYSKYEHWLSLPVGADKKVDVLRICFYPIIGK